LPVDEMAVLDGEGFLDAQSVYRWPTGATDRPQSVTELAGQPGSFVLLAADGAGKTRVLESLRAMEAAPTVVNLLALDAAGIREELQQAVAAGGPVYLDALEIAARYVPNLFYILEGCLSAAPAATVPWRLACRPAAWEGARAAGLDSALLGFRQLRLLPLTRRSARDAVSAVTSNPDGFLDEAVRADLGWLAASPLRLLSAASQWEATGHLPDSQLSSIEYQVEELLKETSNRQRMTMTVLEDRRRRLAGRLAAMSVFGLADRFTTSSGPQPGTLQMASLPSDPEPDSPAPVTLAEVTEVLGTALFDAAGDATVGFRHQQYAEFLAAEYVVSRQVTRSQVHSLLGMNDDNVIPGPMIGSAAWLTVLSVQLGSDFAAANAVALAESAVELPMSLREPVVDAILTRAAAEDMDGLPRQDLALVYPGLEARLAARISDGVRSSGELWWISRLAQAGACRQLAARLLWEILALPWEPWARCAGVAAVAALGDDADVARLEALAGLSPADDPGDDVLAAVIEVLFPRVLDTTALVAILRPQRKARYFGPYRILLAELSDRIPTEELTTSLSWASGHAADGDDAYGDLLPGLLRRGWDNVAAPGVREALARLVAAAATSPNRVWPYGQVQHPWRDSPPGSRRELAVRVAAYLQTDNYFPLIDLGLLISSDLGWLLDTLPSLAQPERDALAQCVSSLVRQPTAAEADLILGMTDDHPAYAYTRWLRGEVSTDSPEAQRARDRARLAAASAGQRAAARPEQYRQLITALRDAATDPGQWQQVARHLVPVNADSRELLSSDLTARPGWALLNAAQQQQVLDLGLLYLQQHQLRPSSWMGYDSFPPGQFGDAVADWSGVYLLATLARHAPASLSAVTAATWRAWTPAIMGAWTVGGRADLRARRQLTDLVPAAERQSLLDAALRNLDALQANGGRLTTANLYEHLCPDLAAPLLAGLTEGRYGGTLGQHLLNILVRCAPRDSLPACRLITATPGHALAQAARRGLAELEPGSLVSQLEASPVQPDDLDDIAGHLNLSLLSDSQLAGLARLLLDYVPLASDPPLRLAVHDREPLDELRRVRRGVMNLLADHGQYGFFQDLAAQPGNGSQQVTGWYLRQARAHATERSYVGRTPRQLLHLLGQADARLVRNSNDLLDVIRLQLDDLQRELTQLGRSRILWDFNGDQGTPKDENTITNEIADRLKARLNASGLLDREVEVTPSPKGIGTRIDLKATMSTASYPAGTASVIIEAKLATNRSLRTALKNQLVRQYLVPTGCQHGIYLVYWAKPEQWHASPANRDGLLRELQQQAAEVGSGIHVRPYILDISYQQSPTGGSSGGQESPDHPGHGSIGE
jgi:hypothetical protein